jgi:Ca-activated chloride channel family protein
MFQLKYTKKMSSFGAIFFSLSLTQVNAQSAHQMQREGDAAYDKKEFQKAEDTYRKAEEKKPSQGRGTFNLGNAKFQQKQYDEAAKQYTQAAEDFWKKEDQAAAFYNLGNTFLERKDYNKSIDAYKNALRRNPDDLDAKKNLTLALQKKKKEEEQKKQQQKNQQQQNKPQNQDQNQQNQDKNQQQQQNPTSQKGGSRTENQPQKQENQHLPKEQQAQELLLKSLEEADKKTLRKVQQQGKPIAPKNGKDW